MRVLLCGRRNARIIYFVSDGCGGVMERRTGTVCGFFSILLFSFVSNRETLQSAYRYRGNEIFHSPTDVLLNLYNIEYFILKYEQ